MEFEYTAGSDQSNVDKLRTLGVRVLFYGSRIKFKLRCFTAVLQNVQYSVSILLMFFGKLRVLAVVGFLYNCPLLFVQTRHIQLTWN